MATLDEQIAQMLQDSLRSGELQRAPSWGRPMPDDDGWAQTPEALRMPFKVLKDAGLVPPEVELFREIGQLDQQLQAMAGDPAQARAIRQRILELRQRLALRLEKLRISGSL